jgi:hypothetical protein
MSRMFPFARWLALCLAPVPAFAQTTWHVDAAATPPGAGTLASPYASVQFALAQPATLSGDMVLVAPGTYAGNVDFLGKDVVVQSSGGAAATILDANLSGSVVTFKSGETSAAVLDGFTLRNGRGTSTPPADVDGGGVYCVNSSPTLRNLVVRENLARRGGGLFFTNSTARLELSTITLNGGLCYTCYPMSGGGIWSASAIVVDRCTISLNKDVSEGGGAYGAGAYTLCTFQQNVGFLGGGARGVGATYERCTFDSNVAGSVDADPGFGGGVHGGTLSACALVNNHGGQQGGGAYGAVLHDCDLIGNRASVSGLSIPPRGGGAAASTLTDCRVNGNVVSAPLQVPGEGGGLYACTATRSTIGANYVFSAGSFALGTLGGGGARSSTLVDCVVVGNVVDSPGSGTDARGGGLAGGSATGTLFYSNGAPHGGGAADATLVRCTLTENTAFVAGGGVAALSGATSVDTSIVWNNAGPAETFASAGTLVITYSDVAGGFAGTGNIALDPQFVAAVSNDYHLTASSPCWNSGNPALVLDPDGTRADMGAFPFDRGASPAGTTYCFGDGALADHTTPCPCGNNGVTGNGCAHSANPAGAHLAASGSTSADDVVLYGSGTPLTAFGLFLQHDALGDRTFHDGVLCANGNLVRLRGRAAVQGALRFPEPTAPQDATLTLSQRGLVTPGSGARRYYALWFRNASTSFCPPATANVTNGYRLDW